MGNLGASFTIWIFPSSVSPFLDSRSHLHSLHWTLISLLDIFTSHLDISTSHHLSSTAHLRLLSAHPNVTRYVCNTICTCNSITASFFPAASLALHHYFHCTITHSCSRPITHASAAHLHKTSHLQQNLLNNTPITQWLQTSLENTPAYLVIMSPSTNTTLTGSSLTITQSCLSTSITPSSDFWLTSQRTTSRQPTLRKHNNLCIRWQHPLTLHHEHWLSIIFHWHSFTQSIFSSCHSTEPVINVHRRCRYTTLEQSLLQKSNVLSSPTRTNPPARENSPPYCYVHLPLHPLLHYITRGGICTSSLLNSFPSPLIWTKKHIQIANPWLTLIIWLCDRLKHSSVKEVSECIVCQGVVVSAMNCWDGKSTRYSLPSFCAYWTTTREPTEWWSECAKDEEMVLEWLKGAWMVCSQRAQATVLTPCSCTV